MIITILRAQRKESGGKGWHKGVNSFFHNRKSVDMSKINENTETLSIIFRNSEGNMGLIL